MFKAILVAIHEIRIYLQDKGDLAFSLLLPVVTFALMYGAFGGEMEFHGTAHIVNQDPGGSYSVRLLEQLEEMDSVDLELLSREEADGKLERSDLLMVIYIPEDFSGKLASGEQTQLLFRQRGNGGQEGQIVASLVRGLAERMNQEFTVLSQTSNSLAGKGIPRGRIEITAQKFLEREQEHPMVGVTEETMGSNPDLVNQFLPGVLTMFVLFAITLGAQAIVQERRLGTLERLLTTRLSVGQLFFGKFLAGISRGFLQTLVLLGLSYIVLQLFTPLAFVECLVIALVFAAAASALGLIIASIARTEDQATWIAVFFTMSMVMLGGTFFEISEGSVLYTISRVSLNTYANDAFETIIAQGGSLTDVGMELGVLAGVAVVGLTISRVLFKVMPGGR
ncbi:MAG TPA: ABC transporter permease [Dehalococcoidales bacterium]|nr:ABC transporter permease [Dehalococcoidales bacterium]